MHAVRRHTALSVPRGGIHDREVELFRGCTKLNEKLQRLIHNLHWPRVRAVYLIDDDNRNLAQLQRLAQHKPRLRHAAFERVHEQQNTVHHL
ncbi:hypothetical protein SDC9_96209 [bioreactor metagenome]|uniref:Uncharacterized protein n=1 Tax=bioreactor metagenome TaxID=1076179 RepID=A0A645A8H3_9ZZZZ